MTVVSNTSPIINLAAIGQLELLQQLYTHIIIPEQVYNEIVVQGAGQPGAMAVQNTSWFERRIVGNQAALDQLLARNRKLHVGEAAAIMLAVEINAQRILLDESIGRAVAAELGVPVTGVLGILIAAKQRGIIPSVKPLVDDLTDTAHFWITPALYDRVLAAAGER